MPEEPQPLPMCYSDLSLLDIISYLEKQYKTSAYHRGEDEEEGDVDEDIGYHYRRLADQAQKREIQAGSTTNQAVNHPISNPISQ